jgi:transcriptional regulator with XRE-family HTH domain
MNERPRFADIEALRVGVAAAQRIPKGGAERRRLRDRAGVSLADLAELVGVSAQTLLRWERGEHVPAVHAVAYAQALDALTPPESTELTAEDRADIRAKFQAGQGCAHCGGYHVHACPRVKRFAFHTNEAIAEVEFWPDGKWPTGSIIWPEDVVDPDDE